MSKREDLKPWVIDALRAHGGRATIIEVCQHIWEHHEGELKSSEDLFYTWQYDCVGSHKNFGTAVLSGLSMVADPNLGN